MIYKDLEHTDFEFKFQKVEKRDGDFKAHFIRSSQRTSPENVYYTEDDTWKLDCLFNDAAIDLEPKVSIFKPKILKKYKNLINSWKEFRRAVIDIQAEKKEAGEPRTTPYDFCSMDKSNYGI